MSQTAEPSTAPGPRRPAAAPIALGDLIRAGDTVIWGQACAEPLSLTRALVDQAPGIGRVRAFVGIGAPRSETAAAGRNLGFIAYGGGGITKRFDSEGRLDVLTSSYAELPGLFETRRVPIDVALVQVTESADPEVFHLALAAEYLVAACSAARRIIVEVNAGAPHSPDAPTLRRSDVDAVVRADYEPAAVPPAAPDAVDRAIGAHVASLVEDGATVQTGIGALPDAVVRALDRHQGLGVHSGAVGDAVADLILRGVVTNENKGVDPGVTVTGVLVGSTPVFELAHRNRALALRDTRYTHNQELLAGLPRLTAINGALEVDLTGQVNCEVAGGRYVGAAGGTIDFMRGARRSRGGIPITVLRSSVRGRSTIVGRLSGPTTVPRGEVGVVVTEQGIADLRGLTLTQRRDRLLAIAAETLVDEVAKTAPGPGQLRTIEREHTT